METNNNNREFLNRLENFLGDSEGMTTEEVKAELVSEGVDVEGFGKRVDDLIESKKQEHQNQARPFRVKNMETGEVEKGIFLLDKEGTLYRAKQAEIGGSIYFGMIQVEECPPHYVAEESIGAETPGPGMPTEWVDNLRDSLGDIPVWVKNNARYPEKVQELPEGLR